MCTLQTVEKHFEKLQGLMQAHNLCRNTVGADGLLISKARQWILVNLCGGNWNQRSKISEAAVASGLQIGRIPVRAAMDGFCQEGWVERIPKRS